MPQRPTAVFLDRDGTVIRDTHFISDPNHVELLDGAGAAIAQLNQEGIPVILVTNQSGIGRGLFTIEQYNAVHSRMVALLAEQNAHLDASYYCPDLPSTKGGCRKPRSKLFQQAIEEHHLDTTNLLFIGDRWRDLAPMLELGGTGFLVPSNSTTDEDLATAQKHVPVVPSLQVAIIDTLR